jgi:hypothetical protein
MKYKGMGKVNIFLIMVIDLRVIIIWEIGKNINLEFL